MATSWRVPDRAAIGMPAQLHDTCSLHELLYPPVAKLVCPVRMLSCATPPQLVRLVYIPEPASIQLQVDLHARAQALPPARCCLQVAGNQRHLVPARVATTAATAAPQHTKQPSNRQRAPCCSPPLLLMWLSQAAEPQTFNPWLVCRLRGCWGWRTRWAPWPGRASRTCAAAGPAPD